MDTIEIFKQNAENVSTKIIESKNMSKAMEEIIEYIPKGSKVAIYGIEVEKFPSLMEFVKKNNITIIKDKLRNNLEKLDIGICIGDIAVANTATVILKSNQEDLRLLTMICDTNIIFIKKKDIVTTFDDCILEIKNSLNSCNYISYISGSSRTADIERVLTLGVHGPGFLILVILDN